MNTKQIKQYIEENIDLIDNNEFEQFFKSAPPGTGGILYAAGIPFLQELNYVPPEAFIQDDDLDTIKIPNHIIDIGDSAFAECLNLTSVMLPDSVESISKYAFFKCSGLASIIIPDSVTSIGYRAFFSCTGLTSVTIGNGVTSIGDDAFYNCSGLTSVHITDIAKWCEIPFGTYYANPFYYAKNLYLNGELVTELVIPEGVTSIGDYTFYGCTSLTSITIPDSVISIGEGAFSGCNGLTSVTIPDSVKSIGICAFSKCLNLAYITIGIGVKNIDLCAFLDLGNNLIIEYKGNKAQWKQICHHNVFNNPYYTVHCSDGDIIKRKR